jgi:O-glycosyl hydrolase
MKCRQSVIAHTRPSAIVLGAACFSQFVKRGAKRVLTSGTWSDKIAFVNVDGSTVIVLDNTGMQPTDVTLTVAGRPSGDTIKVTLPAQSINTIVVSPSSSTEAHVEVSLDGSCARAVVSGN